MPDFVRFRSPHENARGDRVGVFALANGLAVDGLLSAAETEWLRKSNDWYNEAYDEPSKHAPGIFDRSVHPVTECWFKSSASQLLERVDGYTHMLDAHGVEWERVESTSPGIILFEDDVQVVIAPWPDGENSLTSSNTR